MSKRSSFYVGIASTVILIVFVGFAPTYYLKGLFGTPSLSLLHHVHGVVASVFVMAFLVQAILVFTNRTKLHMRVGRFAGWAAVLTAVTMGMLAVHVASASNQTVGLAPSDQAVTVRFFLGDMTTTALFSVFVGLGLINRRRPEFHKRFMLLGLFSLMPPTIGRIASFGARDTPEPMIMLPIFLGLLAAPIVYEFLTRGRPHAVYAVGSPVIFLGAIAAAFVLPQIGFLRELVLRL